MWWIAPLGLAVGITLGALGGGGAILTVPILVYLLGQSPKAATAGSLIIVALTSLVGMLPHYRARRVRLVEGVTFGVLGVVGSVVGSKASASVPGHVLMSAFAVLMFVVAVLMTRKRRQQARADARAERDGTAGVGAPAPLTLRDLRADRRAVLRVILAATGVGLLTGFFGVGGGFAVVPALVLALGFPMQTAVGTSLLVIVINSVTALGSRLSAGIEVDWPLILLFSLFGAAGSLLGGRVAQKVDPRTLNLAFTLLLVAVGTYVAVVNVPLLFA